MGDLYQKRRDAEEAERRKLEVGMAEPGTLKYYQNAKYVLDAYTNPNKTTERKRSWINWFLGDEE